MLDEEGHAVAGLGLLARSWRLFGGPEARPRAARAPRRSITDADGRFFFEPLPDGEYELETDETGAYEKAQALVRAGVDSAVLTVKAKSGSLYVHGVVESTRGGPVTGARVDVVGQPRLATLSDESGEYGLRIPLGILPPQAALRFSRSGYRDRTLPIGAPESLEANHLLRNVRLTPLQHTAAVTGSVTGDDGLPVRQASVQLASGRRQRTYEAFTDDGGRFSFGEVDRSEDYRLWVRPQGRYKDHVQERVSLGSEATALDVVLESLRGASLQGFMVDAEGRPVPGFSLWVRAAHGFSTKTVTGDAQGRFVMEDMPEGPVTLETRSSPLIAITGIHMKPGEAREVRLTLDVGELRLEGHLLTPDGLPVAGARVSLYRSSVEEGLTSQSFRESVTDASGSFFFTQLGPGVHTLNVAAAGFRNSSRRQPVGLDTAPLEIRLQPLP